MSEFISFEKLIPFFRSLVVEAENSFKGDCRDRSIRFAMFLRDNCSPELVTGWYISPVKGKFKTKVPRLWARVPSCHQGGWGYHFAMQYADAVWDPSYGVPLPFRDYVPIMFDNPLNQLSIERIPLKTFLEKNAS
jgi:hypothetical protein